MADTMTPRRTWMRRGAAVFASLVVVAVTAGVLWRAWPAPRQSGLVFEKTEVIREAKISETEVVAGFAFRNGGSEPVRILQVKSDCSWTKRCSGRASAVRSW